MIEAGGCRCGAVRYEVDGAPTYSALCWCTECRKSAGATPVGWTLFPRDRVRITGEVTDHRSSAESTRQFCPSCGTGLFFLNEQIFPGQIDIQAATFDDPDAFPPTGHIQVADAPAWRAAMGEMREHGRFPPMPD